MPEIVETPPEVPHWYNWTLEETREALNELEDESQLAMCDCCQETVLLRAVRRPSFSDLSRDEDHSWVTTQLHRTVDSDPLYRLDWVRFGGYGWTTQWYRDVEYPNIGESYDYICENCHDDRSQEDRDNNESESDYVHDYGFRPRVTFFTADAHGEITSSRYATLAPAGLAGKHSPASLNEGSAVQIPYFGFELEMTRERSPIGVNEAARYIYERLGSDTVGYMKWDGSVDGGFELVTHPHTLEAYNSRTELWGVLEHLRENGWRSWRSSSSCGLHIHINNASFVTSGHAMRFLLFVYRNREPLVRFAGRDSSYARFDYDQFIQSSHLVGYDDNGDAIWRRGSLMDIVKKKSVNEGRYMAVNCQNNNTYELRFFKGNMNSLAVRACLEFVHALHAYTENLTSHDCLVNRALTWRPFLAFVKRKSAEDNFQYRRLYERLLLGNRNGDSGFLNTGGGE